MYLNKNKIAFYFLIYLVTFVFIDNVFGSKVTAQARQGKWDGKKGAIALTYDDGLEVHLDNVIPVLDANEFKATFYVPTNSNGFKNRMAEWKLVADNGHELGNHTVFHPCAGKSKNREWVTPDRDLDTYSFSKILAEIKQANKTLTELDAKKSRTFAYTCGDTKVMDTSFVSGIKTIFPSARGVNGGSNDLDTKELYNLKAYSMSGQSGTDMKVLVDQAISEERLVIFLFHGVEGAHNLDVTKEAHDELICYLKEKEHDLWVDSLVTISAFIKEHSTE